MTTLALIGAGEGGERRVAALEKLASENGLVDIRLVNPRQDPEQIASVDQLLCGQNFRTQAASNVQCRYGSIGQAHAA